MKTDPTLSRLEKYLAQLEQRQAPLAATQPFQEAVATLASLRALQEEAQAKQKALSAHADQAPRIEAQTTPEGYI